MINPIENQTTEENVAFIARDKGLLHQEHLRLFEFPQIFSTSSIWLEKGMEKHIATYDVVIRDLPKNRNFLLLGGVEEIISQLVDWRYTEEEITYLLNLRIITEKFADYLRNFRFTGDVHALPEGTVFFPGEPIIRITAPIIEGNLLSLFIINAVSGNTAFLSKFIRPMLISQGKKITGPGGIRAQSFESGMKACRAAHICGLSQVLPSFYRKYKLIQQPPIIIAYHAYIKSFPTELEAMREIVKTFPTVSFMVDTYDINTGVDNAIKVALELKEEGKSLAGIVIDSGDLFQSAVMARQKLDRAGLSNVKIVVASNLDEFKIEDLIKRKIPADGFVIATEAITLSDDPKIETVYKISEIHHHGKTQQVAKLTPGKESLPGKKQVFRSYTSEGKIQKDIIGLESENLGKKLLIPYIEKGVLTRELPHLDEIKKHVVTQIESLPNHLKELRASYENMVETSKEINQIMQELRETHLNKGEFK